MRSGHLAVAEVIHEQFLSTEKRYVLDQICLVKRRHVSFISFLSWLHHSHAELTRLTALLQRRATILQQVQLDELFFDRADGAVLQ